MENPPTSEIASVASVNRSGWWSTSHCDPKVPPASSSDMNAKIRSRGGTYPVVLKSRATATIIATMSFMSTAPRPQT